MGKVALNSAAVALIVKRAVVRAARATGMTTADAAAMAEGFSCHSLRAGHATSAARKLIPR